MKVIGKKLGLNPTDNICRNSNTFLKDTISCLGINFNKKEIKAKNIAYNDILLYFDSDISYLKTFLLLEGYELVQFCRTENDLKKYIKEKRIKVKIKNGEVLIGNIYALDKNLKCVGIVLAKQEKTLSDKVDTILEI